MSKEKKVKTIGVRLTAESFQKLKNTAEKNNVSMTDLVQLTIDKLNSYE
jgi:hypothetical protein